MQQGVVGDMKALGVREAYKSKLQVRERDVPLSPEITVCRAARLVQPCMLLLLVLLVLMC